MAQPRRHFSQCTSSTGSPLISLLTQSTTFAAFESLAGHEEAALALRGELHVLAERQPLLSALAENEPEPVTIDEVAHRIRVE
jgi:hypothetical protein